MSIDVVADERTKREIYLAGFEKAVKKAKPWTVMCSYNKEGGTYLSDHSVLLGDLLKKEWGFDGVVVSDWGACNDRVQGVRAGMDLEMPSSNGKNDEKIVAAVENGELSEEELDEAVLRILKLIDKAIEKTDNYKYDIEAHHALAKEAAIKSCVLLKNEGILPIDKNEKVLVIGEFAENPRYQGAGSSQINPHKVDTALKTLDLISAQYEYTQGYTVKSSERMKKRLIRQLRWQKTPERLLYSQGLQTTMNPKATTGSILRCRKAIMS